MSDTIFALATPPGKSGVAVVRVSGPLAWTILEELSDGAQIAQPRLASVRTLTNPVSRETIDRAMIIGFRGPASFTGEDVVEYHLHGSPAVLQSLFTVLSSQDQCRMAEPGEFTRRAFENGKIDLTEAEAIADLVDAETLAQKNQALSQMGGALFNLYTGWTEDLTKALAYVEAVIDFPDEDVPDEQTKEAVPAIQKLAGEMSDNLNDSRRGERLRDGLQVVVIGAPNAGKSSLVNALAKRDIAIVSDLAGTTRDILEAHLDVGGYPVTLIDTAGLRPDQLGSKGHDSIESEGIRRALERAKNADIKLLVFDAMDDYADSHTLDLYDDNAIAILNKCDRKKPDGFLDPEDDDNDVIFKIPQILWVSAETGDGLDAIIEKLTEKIEACLSVSRETPSLTRQRHRDALEESMSCLESALQADLPELMAEDLRMAVRHLGRITGKVDAEDLLDVIFRDFCIGK